MEGIPAAAFKSCISLEKSTLGKNVKIIEKEAFASSDLIKEINSHNPTAPTVDDTAFDNYLFYTAKVYVPNEDDAITSYKNALWWSDFFNIEGKDFSGITDIVVDEQEGEAIYYNLQGQRVLNPSHGIYIKNNKKVLLP